MTTPFEYPADTGTTFRNPPPSAIRVAVVDSDDRVRGAWKALLEGTDGFSCLEAFSESACLPDLAKQSMPDVVLMDLGRLGMDGVETVRQARRALPGTAFLVFAPEDDEALIFEALCAGAQGCLAKPTAPAKVLEAIREAHAGGSPMSSSIASRVVRLFRQGWVRSPVSAGLSLTRREKEVLSGLADGRSYKEIAMGFRTSVNTVRFHIRNLYEKLKANSQAEAVAKGLRMGLI